MSGNVSEMTQDCYNGDYNNAPTNGSAWQNGDCNRRVVRGGAWQQNEVGVRVSARSGWGMTRNYITDSVGFRVAQDLPQ